MTAPVESDLRALRRGARAQALFSLGRHRLAAREARAALADEPASAELHILLAVCLSELGEVTLAERAAVEAVRLSPDDGASHKAMAIVLLRADRPDAAERAVREARRHAPEDPDVHALSGLLRLHRGEYDGALAEAERGLALDPRSAEVTSIRAIALSGLDRAEAADSAASALLAGGPEDAGAHAVHGLVRMRAGDFTAAREHLHQALRLSPGDTFVRDALREMLKARNPAYAALLRAHLWLSRRSAVVRVGLVVAAVAALRNATMPGVTADTTASDLLPYALVVMAWLSLAAAPVLFDLTLLIDPFGRVMLRPAESRAAVAVGAAVGAALGVLVAGAVTGRHALVFAAIATTLAAGAGAVAVRCRAGWRRRVAVGGALVTGLLAASASIAAVVPVADSAVVGLAVATAACVFGVLARLVASCAARRMGARD